MALELHEIHKHFGSLRANDGISLTVEAGTLHGLLGENGAGKSTLMKVLSGYHSADSGTITLDGRQLKLASPDDAIAAGIGMLHQDPLVFLPFTVLDNFLLASPGGAVLDRKEGEKELARVSEQFGFKFQPDALARTLSVGERQQLEIVRLLWLGARVLILDEPTTGISATQRVELFATLRTLAGGGMIVIFVSHKLEEIEELCQKVTVMRRGKVVGEADMPVSTDRLVEMMFGQVLVTSDRPEVPLGGPALELDGVTVHERLTAVEDLSLSVDAGEVIGLAGLEGSGQRTLLRTCAGLLKPETGRVRLTGRDLTGAGYHAFQKAGVHFLPAGRLEEGLVPGLSISDHFLLAHGMPHFFIDQHAATEEAARGIEGHFIKGRPDSTADSLSGGNQQRLLLAMMPPRIELLLMEHPTRGLDIESAEWVWTQLLKRREDGTAIMFASADLDELLRYSDRIVVFFGGRVLKMVQASATDPEALGYLIGGKERV